MWALSEEVEPAHVIRPRSFAETLIFRQLYETLVRVDCQGRVQPALAASWKVKGREFRFRLRRDASFWDGTPVTAAAIRAAWADAGATGIGMPFASLSVMSPRIFAVTLRPGVTVDPALFADPGLAVSKPSVASAWRQGTGSFRPAGTISEGRYRRLALVRRASGSEAQPSRLELLIAPGVDPRDLLDEAEAVDLLVTDEPAALDYARTRVEFRLHPLPWHRTLVLLLPAWTSRAEQPELPPGFRESLAADAVRAEARASQGPLWWQANGCTPVASARPSPGAGTRRADRILYRRGDRAARDVAERLVALAAAGRSASHENNSVAAAVVALLHNGELRAESLDPTELRAALRQGSGRAGIISLPRRVLAPCLPGMAELEWLTEIDAVPLPLVDTRRQLVASHALPTLQIDWDGSLRLAR